MERERWRGLTLNTDVCTVEMHSTLAACIMRSPYSNKFSGMLSKF